MAGLEDGSIHVYDYSKNKHENYQKQIFAVKSSANAASHPHDLDNSLERFSESIH